MDFDATFIIAAISFILFVIIMNKILYAPVMKIMQERQMFVDSNFTEAKHTNEETDRRTKYHDGELEKSRDEARNEIAQKTAQLKQECSKEMALYKENLMDNITKEKENLRNSALSAKDTLKDKVVDIAKDISSKILGNDINVDTIDKSQIKEEQV